MSDYHRDGDNLTWAGIIIAIICILFLIWSYRSRYAECMKVKNDKFICETYARPGG